MGIKLFGTKSEAAEIATRMLGWKIVIRQALWGGWYIQCNGRQALCQDGYVRDLDHA